MYFSLVMFLEVPFGIKASDALQGVRHIVYQLSPQTTALVGISIHFKINRPVIGIAEPH